MIVGEFDSCSSAHVPFTAGLRPRQTGAKYGVPFPFPRSLGIAFLRPVQTIVIGHKNPDMDSVCSALGYAEFKRAMGTKDVVAARAVRRLALLPLGEHGCGDEDR